MKVTIDGDAGAVVVDLASRRQAVPTIQDRLSPAAMRRLGATVGDLAEALGGSLTTVPAIEPVYVGDGRASIAIIMTVNVADLNRHAAEPDAPSDRAATVRAAMTDAWQTAEAIGEASGLGWCMHELRELFAAGLVERGIVERPGVAACEMWRRR